LSEVVATAVTELIADKTQLLAGLAQSEQSVKQSAQSGEKYYADSGKKAGGLFGSAVTGGLKVLGTGAALAFGIATKGAIELEDQVAAFRAETGASSSALASTGRAGGPAGHPNGMDGVVQGVVRPRGVNHEPPNAKENTVTSQKPAQPKVRVGPRRPQAQLPTTRTARGITTWTPKKPSTP
jgi:hypothetical protein